MGNKKNKKDIEEIAKSNVKFNSVEKKKITILIVISTIISVISEIFLVKLANIYSTISIARLITIFGIVVFIGLHFVIGFKKLYEFIVEKRFKISAIMIIISTIIGFFQNQFGIKEWILNTDTTLSLWWNIKFYSLLLISYELFNIITNKNKSYSIIGTIVVIFSGAVQWNFNKIDSLILGEFIVVLVYKFLNKEKNYKKILISCGIVGCCMAYMFSFEGYAISFAYIFISLIIWIILKNKNMLKDKNTKLIGSITLIASIVVSALIKVVLIPHYNDDTIIKNSGLANLYSYLYNVFLPFYNIEDKALCGSFLSMFPLPMFLALYYIYKNDDHLEFLLPITIVTVLETIFCLSGFPAMIEKITLFSYVSLPRCVAAVNLACVYIVFYMLSNFNKMIFSIPNIIKITFVLMIILVFIGYPEIFATKNFLSIFAIEISVISFLFLNFDDKNYKNVFLFFVTLIVLIGGVSVNPIIKGDISKENINENQVLEDIQKY